MSQDSGYNLVKMVPDKEGHVCNFSIPLKEKKINGRIMVIQKDGDLYLKLFDVTQKEGSVQGCSDSGYHMS